MFADAPAPDTAFRDDVLDRHPEGPGRDLLVRLARCWVETGEWRFRQTLGTLAGGLLVDATFVHNPNEDRDPWMTAESVIELAEACRSFVAAYDSYVAEGAPAE